LPSILGFNLGHENEGLSNLTAISAASVRGFLNSKTNGLLIGTIFGP
jgi:hypothetical protein